MLSGYFLEHERFISSRPLPQVSIRLVDFRKSWTWFLSELLMLRTVNPRCWMGLALGNTQLSFISKMGPNLDIRGRSDKYLVYKRKTKILEKRRFISQHSLLLAWYTWPSDASISLTRLKKKRFLDICKVGFHGGDNLLIRLKFLPGERLFRVWKQKEVTRGQIWRIWWMK